MWAKRHPDKWRGSKVRCKATVPHAHEWREWLSIFARYLGVSKVLATIAFIRWRMGGSRLDALPPGIPRPAIPPPPGVGTHIHRLLASLGAKPNSSCNCNSLADEWDRKGIEWCKEHKDELVAKLRESYSRTDWPTVLRAAALSLGGIAWQINWLGPLGSLVDLAIERAEKAAEK